MTTVFVGIGSNMGDKGKNCQRALALLGEKCILRKVSSLYETEPWGNSEQEDFVNCVVEVATSLGVRRLLSLVKGIETSLGRITTSKWGQRTIDLDILLYGDMVVEEEGLKIPHPFLHQRAFVLVPLAEIAPTLLHPLLNKSPVELLSELDDPERVKRLDRVSPIGAERPFYLDGVTRL
ncbi:MAG: 2-amino-4-hydroxy-6-hydroxymethyldihydropteridine diphosphokinase [Thermodesulfobacteriota bacterium]